MIARHIHPSRRGFTLVEVLIAIAILVTGMTGVIAVFAAAARSHARAIHSIEAGSIASSVVAQARTVYRDISELPQASGTVVPGKPRYNYDTEYFEGWSPDDSETLMIVTVHWQERGRESSLRFVTILARKMD